MASVSKGIFVGRLCADPELKTLAGGTLVARLRLVVNNKRKDAQGQLVDTPLFIDCDAFGKTAESAGQYLAKGKEVYLDGQLVMETWDDKSGGGQRSKIKLLVNTMQFIGSKGDSEQTGDAAEPSASQPVPVTAPTSNAPPPAQRRYPAPANRPNDSDIPF